MNPYDLIRGFRRVFLRSLLKHNFGYFGKGSSFDPVSSNFIPYSNIFIGSNVYIGPNAILSADKVRISIGDDTIIGPGLYIMAGDHLFSEPGITYHLSPDGVNEDVKIGRNVWIGARVTILKGISIGDAAIIGAGSVVINDIPDFAIYAGNPARLIKQRFEGEDKEKHQNLVINNLKNPKIK